jgi:hypothetical protein
VRETGDSCRCRSNKSAQQFADPGSRSKQGGRKKLLKAAKLQQETATFKQIEQEILWLCGAKRDVTKTLSTEQIGGLRNAAKMLETS